MNNWHSACIYADGIDGTFPEAGVTQMSPAATQPKAKFELGAHQAGVAVDGFVPESASLERFAEQLNAALDALEAKFEDFRTPSSYRKAMRG